MFSGTAPRAEGFRLAEESRGPRVPAAAAVGAKELGPRGISRVPYGLLKPMVLEQPVVRRGLVGTCWSRRDSAAK